jgi:hypothetical protein
MNFTKNIKNKLEKYLIRIYRQNTIGMCSNSHHMKIHASGFPAFGQINRHMPLHVSAITTLTLILPPQLEPRFMHSSNIDDFLVNHSFTMFKSCC